MTAGAHDQEEYSDSRGVDTNLTSYLYGDPFCGYVSMHAPERQASYYIRLLVFPVLLLLGIVGNLLAIPVLYSIGRTAWSTVWYLTLLATIDLIILLIRCGDTWYYQVMEVSLSQQIQGSSDAACRTYTFAFMFVKHLSPWLMVATAVEMTIATRWPGRTYSMCSHERARNVVMLLTIVVVCLDMNHFWTWGVPQPGVGCRDTEAFSETFMNWIWPAMDNLVELLLPLLTVCVCLVLTSVTRLRRTPEQEKRIAAEMRKYFLELPTLCDFRSVCLALSLLFTFTVLFKTTVNVINFLFWRGYLQMGCSTLARFRLALELLTTLDMTFTFAFYSMKIFVYLTMSAVFRSRLRSGFLRLARMVKASGQWCFSRLPRRRVQRQQWSPVTTIDADGEIVGVRGGGSGYSSERADGAVVHGNGKHGDLGTVTGESDDGHSTAVIDEPATTTRDTDGAMSSTPIKGATCNMNSEHHVQRDDQGAAKGQDNKGLSPNDSLHNSIV